MNKETKMLKETFKNLIPIFVDSGIIKPYLCKICNTKFYGPLDCCEHVEESIITKKYFCEECQDFHVEAEFDFNHKCWKNVKDLDDRKETQFIKMKRRDIK